MVHVILAFALVALLAVGMYGVLNRIPYTFSQENRRQWRCMGIIASALAALLLLIGAQRGSANTFQGAITWVSPAIVALVIGSSLYLLILAPGWKLRQMRSVRRFDPDIRIGIVGGGPAGLSVAEELRDRGYRNITILEGRPDAGGKSITRELDGVMYDGGQVWAIPSGRINRYFSRYGIPDRLRDLPRMRYVTREGRSPQNPWIMASKRRRRISLMRLVEIVRYSRALRAHSSLDNIGFRDARYADPIYAEPSHAWFRRHKLPFMEEALGPLIQVGCSGHLVGSMPFGYVAKVLGQFQRYSIAQTLAMAFPANRFMDADGLHGNQALWRRMAESHPGFRPGEPVDAIERGDVVRVRTRKASYEFDQLIWAAPPMAFPGIVKDATSEEADLFSRVRTYRRAVVIARFEGLAEGRLWLYRTTAQDGLPISHPRVIYGLKPGSMLFKCFPGLDEAGNTQDIARELEDFAERHGAKFRGIVAVHKWDYYPHFGPDDIRNGAWQRQEALQGLNRTWFVGELFAGAGIPLAAEYAADLVQQRF